MIFVSKSDVLANLAMTGEPIVKRIRRVALGRNSRHNTDTTRDCVLFSFDAGKVGQSAQTILVEEVFDTRAKVPRVILHTKTQGSRGRDPVGSTVGTFGGHRTQTPTRVILHTQTQGSRTSSSSSSSSSGSHSSSSGSGGSSGSGSGSG